PDGIAEITLEFTLSLGLDVAEQEVQAAINSALTLLPPDLPNPPVYSKVNPADTPIPTLGLTSAPVPRLSPRAPPNPPVSSKVTPGDTPILPLGLTSAPVPLPQAEDLADTRLA